MKAVKDDTAILWAAVFLSLLANAFLFSFQPMMSRITSSGDNANQLFANLVPVKVIHYTKEQDKTRRPEPPLITDPEMLLHDEIVPPPVDLNMELSLPFRQFSINPLLTVGIPVATPEQPVHIAPNLTNTFSLAEVDQPPSPLFQLDPAYPYTAKRANVTGKVSVMFLVDENGNVLEVNILRADPEGIFEESVKTALAKWKFIPGKLQGKNVATWISTNIVFELD